MDRGKKQVSIRIDTAVFAKLKWVAEYDSRSLNREIVVIIKRYIDTFEQQHGEIQI